MRVTWQTVRLAAVWTAGLDTHVDCRHVVDVGVVWDGSGL